MDNAIIKYIINRLKETSTIRGLILLVVSVTGSTLSSEQTESAIYLILGIVGLIDASMPDKIINEKHGEDKTEPDKVGTSE